jgi:molybdate transport repressor ModE-like protein
VFGASVGERLQRTLWKRSTSVEIMAADSSFSQIQAGAGAASPEGRLLFSRMVKQVRLRQLQLLLALQQCGSVMQAAVELSMSQSAATQALAELERVLDIKLFERHARGMRPTVAGQALIDAARGMLVGLQEVSESLASIRRGASAALRLGAIPAAALSVLSQLLPRFTRHTRRSMWMCMRTPAPLCCRSSWPRASMWCSVASPSFCRWSFPSSRCCWMRPW